jgi:hypothetical protein
MKAGKRGTWRTFMARLRRNRVGMLEKIVVDEPYFLQTAML